MANEKVCIDWLVDLVPHIRRVGIVGHTESSRSYALRLTQEISVGKIKASAHFVRDAAEAAALMSSGHQNHIDAWYFPHTPVIWRGIAPIVEAAGKFRMPTAFEYSHVYARDGGLLACAPTFDPLRLLTDAVSFAIATRHTAVPAAFHPGRLEISLNMVTAARVGASVSPSAKRRMERLFGYAITSETREGDGSHGRPGR
jgi:hypothetical protein